MRLLRYIIALGMAVTGATAVAQPALPTDTPVRPGDRVLLWLFDRPSSSGPWNHAATIQADGLVDIPFVGAVRLAGLPSRAALDSVRTRLQESVRPGISAVTIQRRIAVIGFVRRPDVYFVETTLTLNEAIAQAGGVDERGAPKRVLIRRGTEVRDIRNWQMLPPDALESGDQIIVPPLPWYRRNAVSLVSALGVFSSLAIALSR
jgi:protein involved in polysaccharide export with SLBB domain